MFKSTLLLCCLFVSCAFADMGFLTNLTHEYTAAPGEEIHGVIPMENQGDKIERVNVYLTDYRFNCKGENFFDEPVSHDRSSANWLQLSSHYVKVSPQGKGELTYIIKVPEDEKLHGTYWCIIMLEPTLRALASQEEEKMGIQTSVRVAVQTIVNIKGTGEYDMKIINKELVKEDDKVFFVIDIENTGTLSVVPEMWMEIFNVAEKTRMKFTGGKTRVYPETSAQFKLEITEIGKGEHKALVVFDQGEVGVFGAQYDIKLR